MTDEAEQVVHELREEMTLCCFDPFGGELMDPDALDGSKLESYDRYHRAIELIERQSEEIEDLTTSREACIEALHKAQNTAKDWEQKCDEWKRRAEAAEMDA